MSDIGLEFPWWISFAFLGAEYWYVFVPAILLFAGIGWFGRRLSRGWRYAAWGAAGLVAAPFVLLLILIIADAVRGAL
ncbi:MAG: hypothetical protein P4L98_16460 [Ancalomicrobiaceae bacterium]|nr:hypothetical protein [Ancalomicrobiaceae bacterium]